MDLDDDLLAHTLHHLPAESLAPASGVNASWCQLARRVAGDRLSVRWPRPPSEAGPCNIILRLVSAARFERAVGMRPSHSWRDEWVELIVEHERRGKERGRSWCDDDADIPWDVAYADHIRNHVEPIEDVEHHERRSIARWVRLGVKHELAHAFQVITANGAEALFPYRFPATDCMIYDGFAALARATAAARTSPNVYWHVTGQYGLGESDAGWRGLLSEPPVGSSFATADFAELQRACETLFPDDKCDGIYGQGFYEDSELYGTDVVCIRSAANDRGGWHNCVQKPDELSSRSHPDVHILPPGAIVTLVSVQHTWRVRRNTMKCRLFTCDVCFEVW